MQENNTKDNIDSLLQEDVVIQSAVEQTKQDDALIQDTVTEILTTLMGRVENSEDEFSLKHGFLTLGKSINYLAQAMCKDYNHFQAELTAAHRVVVDNIMESLAPTFDEDGNIVENSYDDENFSLRRLMMISGSMVDYVYWRESLSKYTEHREELERDASEKVEATVDTL